jgi:hypothetical protein
MRVSCFRLKPDAINRMSSAIKLSLGANRWFTDIFKSALLAAIDIQNDPILSSVLYCMQLNQYMNLKKKARIPVEKSCVLIGVADPYGCLEENEVFV